MDWSTIMRMHFLGGFNGKKAGKKASLSIDKCKSASLVGSPGIPYLSSAAVKSRKSHGYFTETSP